MSQNRSIDIRENDMSDWERPSATDEWYTPPQVFTALGCTFDMDVSPALHGNPHVPARRLLQGDGLVEPWLGFVWGNFPFGGRNGLAPWLDRFFSHGDGVALTPDRTSAPWFQEAWRRADLVLFTRKIRFLRPDGSLGVSPSNGTALIAAGPRGCAALHNAEAAGFGILAQPMKAAA